MKQQALGIVKDTVKVQTDADNECDVGAVVADLSDTRYDMILCNDDMMRLGLNVQRLPMLWRARHILETTADDENSFETTQINDEQIHAIGQELEDKLNENENIPLTRWCSLPGSVLYLNLNDQDVKHLKFPTRNYVKEQWEEEVTKTVNDWLQQGIIQKYYGKTPVNIAILAVEQLAWDGTRKKLRVCNQGGKLPGSHSSTN